MDTVLFLLHKPLLVFYFRVEEKFAGGKFREIQFAVDIIFAGGKFRAKSKFAKIAKIYSTRKIGVIYIQYSPSLFGGRPTLILLDLLTCKGLVFRITIKTHNINTTCN